MKRTKNIYCWNCLRDWTEAYKNGILKIIDQNYGKNREEMLKMLVLMAAHDCVPFSILCLRKEESLCAVLTEPAAVFFRFLRNEKPLETEDGRELYFEDLDAEQKSQIMEAQIHSVWVKLGPEESIETFLASADGPEDSFLSNYS